MSRWGWGAVALVAAGALLLPWLLPAPEPPVAEVLSPALLSLRSGEYDPRFGLEYWMERYQEGGRGGELGRALRYCRGLDVEERPNCRTIRVLDAASRIPGFFEEAGR